MIHCKRWLVLGLVVVVAGCSGGGPRRNAVSGTVTMSGEPVEQGSITFVPQSGVAGFAANGDIINGRYSIAAADGPVAGRHTVLISAMPKRRPGGETPNQPPRNNKSMPPPPKPMPEDGANPGVVPPISSTDPLPTPGMSGLPPAPPKTQFEFDFEVPAAGKAVKDFAIP